VVLVGRTARFPIPLISTRIKAPMHRIGAFILR